MIYTSGWKLGERQFSAPGDDQWKLVLQPAIEITQENTSRRSCMVLWALRKKLLFKMHLSRWVYARMCWTTYFWGSFVPFIMSDGSLRTKAALCLTSLHSVIQLITYIGNENMCLDLSNVLNMCMCECVSEWVSVYVSAFHVRVSLAQPFHFTATSIVYELTCGDSQLTWIDSLFTFRSCWPFTVCV